MSDSPFIASIVGLIAVLVILFGGFNYYTSHGDLLFCQDYAYKAGSGYIDSQRSALFEQFLRGEKPPMAPYEERAKAIATDAFYHCRSWWRVW